MTIYDGSVQRAHLRFVAVIADPTGFMPVGEGSLVLWWQTAFPTLSSTDIPTLQEVGIGGRIGATNRRCARVRRRL